MFDLIIKLYTLLYCSLERGRRERDREIGKEEERDIEKIIQPPSSAHHVYLCFFLVQLGQISR